MNIKRIIVPINYTAQSFNALYQAIKIALKNDATLILMHSYDINSIDFSKHKLAIQNEDDELKKTLLTDLELLAYTFPKLYEMPVRYEVVFDETRSAITRMVEKHRADMIVMGNRQGNHPFISHEEDSISNQITALNLCTTLIIPFNTETYNTDMEIAS